MVNKSNASRFDAEKEINKVDDWFDNETDSFPNERTQEQLSTKELVVKITTLLNRHVFFENKQLPLLIAVWVLGTYIHEIFTYYGYLWINSPAKRCGKSLLEDLLSHLCSKATPRLSNATEAAIFRLADQGHTLILDEVESVRGEDREKFQAIMTILNLGFQNGGQVPRVVKDKESGHKVVYFNAFSPKVMAGINQIVDTIEDRSFKIEMVRKTDGEHVARFSLRKQSKELEELRTSLSVWASENTKAEITALYDQLQDLEELSAVNDRFKDIAEPLIAIATYADKKTHGSITRDLIAVLRDIAIVRSNSERREDISTFIPIAEQFLSTAREQEVFVTTRDLLEACQEYEDLQEIESAKALANFLGRFGLRPRRDTKGQTRGYLITRSWLDEITSRYGLTPSFAVKSVKKPSADSNRDILDDWSEDDFWTDTKKPASANVSKPFNACDTENDDEEDEWDL